MTEWTQEHRAPLTSSIVDTGVSRSRGGAVRALLILYLVIGALLTNRQALWYFGVPVPLLTMALICSTLLPVVCLLLVYFASVSLPPVPMRHAFALRTCLLFVWVVLLFFLGLIEDHNVGRTVLKEFIGFGMLPAWLLLGRRDQIWQLIRKPLVILFYTAFVLILLTLHAPAATLTQEGFVAGKTLGAPRGLDTIAYAIRGTMGLGPLLFAWGMATPRRDIWRMAMIAALGVYAGVEAILFEFRGAAVAALLLVVIYCVVSPTIRGSIPVGPMLGLFFLGGIAFAIAMQTQGFNNLRQRFEGEGGGIFDSRIDEAQKFFEDMTPLDLVIGRGLAASYVGPTWAPMVEYNGRLIWTSNHFGFLGFVLRGGFPLLLFMLTFVVPYALPKPRGWMTNEYNAAAIIVLPLIIFNIAFNPFDFLPDVYLGMMLWGLCFSRLSTFAPEASWHKTSQPVTDSEY